MGGASYCISSARSAPRTCALFVLIAFAVPTASLTNACGRVVFRQPASRCDVHAALRAGKTLPTPLLEQLGIVGKRGAVCFVDDDRAWLSFKVLSGYSDRADAFAARSCAVVVVRPWPQASPAHPPAALKMASASAARLGLAGVAPPPLATMVPRTTAAAAAAEGYP